MENLKDSLEQKCSSCRFVFESCYSIMVTAQRGKTATNVKKLFIFIFIFYRALVGLAILGIGIFGVLELSAIKLVSLERLIIASWVMIIIGAAMVIISFIGCFGAISESRCLILTYVIFLLVIIIVQLVLAILMFSYAESISAALIKSIGILFDKRSESPTFETLFDSIQEKFKCCGKKNAYDYGLLVPKSCCPKTDIFGATIKKCIRFTSYSFGCMQKVSEFYLKWHKTIATLAIIVTLIELLGVLFALSLINSIRK